MQGVRRARSFHTKASAQKWAMDQEIELESGDVPNKPFSALLKRYRDEVSPTKRGEKWERDRIGLVLRDPLSSVSLRTLAAPDVSAWRDRRLQVVSAASVRREWTLLSHACTVAVREWHWLKANPFQGVKKPPPPLARDRRISQNEIDAIKLASGYTEPPETVTARVCAAFLFAIETGMRAGEIAALTPDNVRPRHVHIPMTKNGNKRDVPLSKEAKRLLKLVGNDFRLSSSQISSLFRKVRDRAMLENLHFHDTRREALSRLSKQLDVMQLAKVSGHKDLRILLSVYYAPDIEDLAGKLD